MSFLTCMFIYLKFYSVEQAVIIIIRYYKLITISTSIHNNTSPGHTKHLNTIYYIMTHTSIAVAAYSWWLLLWYSLIWYVPKHCPFSFFKKLFAKYSYLMLVFYNREEFFVVLPLIILKYEFWACQIIKYCSFYYDSTPKLRL